MPELDDLVLEAIAAHLPARGIVAAFGANGLRIPLLKLVIRVHDAQEIPRSGKPMAMSGIVQIGEIDSIGGGIDVLHAGMGDTLEIAASNAAHQWTEGVLPVVVSWLTRRDQPDVEHSEMVVAIADTGEQFGWKVHLGPVITLVYAEVGPMPETPKSEMFLKLFNELHPFAAHRTLFWLECFAARYGDGRVDATCRKHNDDWEEGRQALLAYAAEWQPVDAPFVSRRQFIIFEPVAVDRELAAKLPVEEPARKPWWRRLWS